jgi:hypothetical protein
MFNEVDDTVVDETAEISQVRSEGGVWMEGARGGRGVKGAAIRPPPLPASVLFAGWRGTRSHRPVASRAGSAHTASRGPRTRETERKNTACTAQRGETHAFFLAAGRPSLSHLNLPPFHSHAPQEDAWAVISAFFEDKGLVRQQLDSFNEFINSSMQVRRRG